MSKIGPWNEEVIAQARTLWREGHTCNEIASRLGLRLKQVQEKLSRMGLRSRARKSNTGIEWTDEMDAVIISGYRTGDPVRSIVAKLNVSRTTVTVRASVLGCRHVNKFGDDEEDDNVRRAREIRDDRLFLQRLRTLHPEGDPCARP